MMKIKSILSFALLFCGVFCYAQDDFTKEFNNFSSNAKNIFEDFNARANKVFADALKENWKEYQACEALEPHQKPKPSTPPQASPEDPVKVDERLEILSQPEPVPTKDTMRSTTDASAVQGFLDAPKQVQFDYFGVKQNVNVPREYGKFHLSGTTSQDVSAFWKKLSSNRDVNATIRGCKRAYETFQMNDWALFRWVENLSAAVYPANVNSERSVLTVFLLNQLGIKCKVACVGNVLTPVVAFRQTIYGKSYIREGGERYYIVQNSVPGASIYSYDFDFPNTSPLDVKIARPLKIGASSDIYNIKKHSSVFGCDIVLPVNRRLIEFYDSCPQAGTEWYDKSVVDPSFAKALILALDPYVKGKSEEEAVTLLLRFLHNDFSYKRDNEQFGREKPFFVEENFVYPFNDCEDRSVLFAFLVRRLTGLKVVLLDYPDHIATAVAFNSPVKGSYIDYSGNSYYVCDPTYVGAGIGEVMPVYRNSGVKVLR